MSSKIFHQWDGVVKSFDMVLQIDLCVRKQLPAHMSN